jgi:tRNA threonylcarbamoyladenosine biosynthesis protein TsaE
LKTLRTDSRSERATEEWGAKIGAALIGGEVIFLDGDLGAGKTTFVRGVLRGLGHTGTVKSPTYTLVEPYSFPSFSVYHFDLYRLNNPEELEFVGLRDYLSGNGVCLFEWPARGEGHLPPPDLSVTISAGTGGRQLEWAAHTQSGERLVRTLT